MTYCLAIHLHDGMVFCSDSRTNAGTDNVGRYSKMHTFSWPGKRFFILLSAGNLATTQMVAKKLSNDIQQGLTPNLLQVVNLTDAADYIGMISTHIQRTQASRDTSNTNFEASFLFGGQIGTDPPEIRLIYPQGNCIHESDEHPFLQIGEIKYGKPILDRVIRRDTGLDQAARVALVSMNSTMRSNVTVGPPIELLIYYKNSLTQGRKLILHEDDPFAREISIRWHKGLVAALDALPHFPWEDDPSSGHD